MKQVHREISDAQFSDSLGLGYWNYMTWDMVVDDARTQIKEQIRSDMRPVRKKLYERLSQKTFSHFTQTWENWHWFRPIIELRHEIYWWEGKDEAD